MGCEPIPIIIAAVFYDLVAILVRPLVGYIIFNIALLTVMLTLYESHRQSHADYRDRFIEKADVFFNTSAFLD